MSSPISRLSILSKQIMTNNTNSSIARGDIGLIGLAVMGQNLILNMADHGYTVVAYNRTTSKVDHFWPTKLKVNQSLVLTLLKNWLTN